MAYSTAAQLQSNVKVLASTYSGGNLTTNTDEAIATADKRVETDLSRDVDFDLVPAIGSDPDTPDFINLLSQYWAAHIALVRMSGISRQTKSLGADADYWLTEYEKLLAKVKDGLIDLELSDGTDIGTSVTKFENTAQPDTEPRMGYGKYGEFLDKDDLADQRETETGGYTG